MNEKIVVTYKHKYILYMKAYIFIQFSLGALCLASMLFNLFTNGFLYFFHAEHHPLMYLVFLIVSPYLIRQSILERNRFRLLLETSNPLLIIDCTGFHSSYQSDIPWETIQRIQIVEKNFWDNPKKYNSDTVLYFAIDLIASDNHTTFIPFCCFDYTYFHGDITCTSFTQKQMIEALNSIFTNQMEKVLFS
ncbi:hypothetical protein [Chakrabartyella piscis]|uniref:hypothetical protein n=1 Tax=Chakrabartyella piscis TaxID=2918914 RepID=UPI002958AFE8|nr:hypothetical protein [Chakrabartyella piscis]